MKSRKHQNKIFVLRLWKWRCKRWTEEQNTQHISTAFVFLLLLLLLLSLQLWTVKNRRQGRKKRASNSLIKRVILFCTICKKKKKCNISLRSFCEVFERHNIKRGKYLKCWRQQHRYYRLIEKNFNRLHHRGHRRRRLQRYYFYYFSIFFFKFFELLNKGKNLFFILSEVKGKKNYFLKQNKKLNNSVSYGLFFSSLFQIILNWTNLKAKRKPIFFSFFFLFLVC